MRNIPTKHAPETKLHGSGPSKKTHPHKPKERWTWSLNLGRRWREANHYPPWPCFAPTQTWGEHSFTGCHGHRKAEQTGTVYFYLQRIAQQTHAGPHTSNSFTGSDIPVDLFDGHSNSLQIVCQACYAIFCRIAMNCTFRQHDSWEHIRWRLLFVHIDRSPSLYSMFISTY